MQVPTPISQTDSCSGETRRSLRNPEAAREGSSPDCGPNCLTTLHWRDNWCYQYYWCYQY